jgi:hypothetical protein
MQNPFRAETGIEHLVVMMAYLTSRRRMLMFMRKHSTLLVSHLY